MRVITSDRSRRWVRGIGLFALAALAWSLLVPGGLFWAAVVGASLIGSAVATAVVVRNRQVPSLAQVIASAEREPVVRAGERRP